MDFDNQKKQALEKAELNDKSRKGSVDMQIISLVEAINKTSDFYTTSSCAGRIILMKPSGSGKKNESSWLFSSHEEVKPQEILASLQNLPVETVWLRMEAPIVHICCRTIEYAEWLMKTANEAGFRRSAMLSTKPRIIVEIFIPDRMDVPVSEKGVLLVTEGYLKVVVGHANRKLGKTREKIKNLELLFLTFSPAALPG